jgi:hypothetical protein
MPCAVLPSGRKPLLLLALTAGLIGGAWWWQRPPPEPIRQGHRLSAWLARHTDDRKDYQTVETLHAFGPGVVPWLAYTVEYGRHPYMGHGPHFMDKAPAWLRRLVSVKWGGLHISLTRDDRDNALRAVLALGPEAAPAIPALARALDRVCQDEEFMVPALAADALHATGTASWPAVEQILQHGNPHTKRVLLEEIHRRTDYALEAEWLKVLVTLMHACGDPDAEVRHGAVVGLRGCRSIWPHLPVLDTGLSEVLQLLSSPDLNVRCEAVQMLCVFNEKAAPAIPRLMALLDYPASWVRSGAAWTLGDVDKVEKCSATRLRTMFFRDPDATCRASAQRALTNLGLPLDVEYVKPVAGPVR